MAADAGACWREVCEFYADGSRYGEMLISQDAHACQAAALAASAGHDDATVVACLLHDIGWKLSCAEPTCADKGAPDSVFSGRAGSRADRLGILSFCGGKGAGAEQQRAQHDVIGATYLRMLGFDEKVPHLVEGHVLAKRYLCYKEPGYHSKLSPASQRTLKFQGGPMAPEEARVFERDPLFQLCMQMRRWDEQAKVPGLAVPPFSHYESAFKRLITSPRCGADQTRGFYIRDGNRILGVREAAARL
eukprot:TRINITY_DN22080_c0_g1_i1.p1 TRINITY_DN22080_c0_g1~~TRINITY_DN22080_c0_g1_i1.p1  ORF type:complete len:270 (+),score=88.35 TRINITY_DN22080_c0_g1_i1:71-811(+)